MESDDAWLELNRGQNQAGSGWDGIGLNGLELAIESVDGDLPEWVCRLGERWLVAELLPRCFDCSCWPRPR
jgi:hypothetical protein